MSDKCFHEYSSFIHKAMGIHIEKRRKVMLVGRIKKRVAELEINDYEDYLRLIQEDQSEKELFINFITTNETYFYRTPRVWDFVTSQFLEEWTSRGERRKLRVWSAAASTGEEAHTMGIICQNFKDSHPGFQYYILGTDISTRVINKAKRGVYKGRAIGRFRDSQPTLFSKYMNGDDDKGYTVSPEIKCNIKFGIHNLFSKPKESEKFHLIFLRNVLIYFTKEDQEKVLNTAYSSLDKDGYLIIGESESLRRMKTNFEPVSPLIYKPKPLSANKGAA